MKSQPRKYTEQGDWIEIIEATNNAIQIARVGLIASAVKEIGPIVWYELPQVGSNIEKGDVVVILESTKAAVDVEAPIKGNIIRTNPNLRNRDEKSLLLINSDSEREGWLYEIEICE